MGQDLSGSTRFVDAIVLAGTHTDRKKWIRGKNKAFLPLERRACLAHVLDALRHSRRVGRIFVVGPEALLREAVPPEENGYSIVPESGRMLDNAWNGFQAAQKSLASHLDEVEKSFRPYLFLTSDIPLAVPEAIDDFVERCFEKEKAAGSSFDFFAGVADEVALVPFYARPPRRGIRRPYMDLKHQRLRLANLFLVRPGKVRNLEVLQQGFAVRKLTEWRNILKLTRVFLGNPGGIRGAAHVICFQMASLFRKMGLPGLAAGPRSLLDLGVVERTASLILGCRFLAVVTPFGGLSIDVDDDSDYEILKENFSVWRKHQQTLLAPLAAPVGSSTRTPSPRPPSPVPPTPAH